MKEIINFTDNVFKTSDISPENRKYVKDLRSKGIIFKMGANSRESAWFITNNMKKHAKRVLDEIEDEANGDS